MSYQFKLVHVGVAVQVTDNGVFEIPGDAEVGAAVVGQVVPVTRRNVPNQQNLGRGQRQGEESEQ